MYICSQKRGIVMKKKEQELLNYLSEFNKPIRSAEIANALDISVRSVKNYVHNINSLYGKNIILSLKKAHQIM